MRSIMHRKEDHTCYLCMVLHQDYTRKVTQEHHVIFGTANRKLSEKYGLKIYLCLFHHEEGPEAVHKNAKIALMTKKDAQRAFIKRWPEKNFREIFGKSYIDETELEQERKQEEGKGFIFIGTKEALDAAGFTEGSSLLEERFLDA